jgi:Flp pilus assembly protein TadG
MLSYLRKPGRRLFDLTRSCRSGVASLELGLVTPVLTMFLTGVVDLSMMFHQELQLSSVLAAGAEYAFTQGQIDSGSTLTTEVTNFVQALSPLTLTSLTTSYNNGLNPSSSYCVVGSPATYSGPYASGSACPDGSGSTAGKFVTISASFTYAAMFKAEQTFFPKPFTQSVIVRLQ